MVAQSQPTEARVRISPAASSVMAKQVISRNNKLEGKRETWMSAWQMIANYVQPRKNQIQEKNTQPAIDQSVDLFDSTAIEANMVLGAGQLQYITPAAEAWAGFEIPEHLRNTPQGQSRELESWYQTCGEITLREIGRSNFYTEVHEFYLDRGAMGTSCLYAAEGKRAALNFQSIAIGTYCIAEDDEGYVDTVYRKFKLSVRQAVQKFGLEALGQKVLDCYYDEGGNRMDEEHTYIHAVQPRADAERQLGKMDGKNKPIASIYVCVEDEVVVSNNGFDELPFFASRYLTWGEEVYGYSPSFDIISTIRQVNFIERNLDALAEIAAFPRVLMPEHLEYQADLRAGGVTYYDPQQQGKPEEWGTAGRYDIGKERVETKQAAIKRAYHNDLFQMLQQQDRQMTAYETMQRVAEKLILFSPTFAKLTTEFLTPLLQRIFGLLYRANYFPAAPPEAFAGAEGLVMPQVTFTSKVSLAIKALQNHAFVEFMGIVGPLVNISPDVIDNIDSDRAFVEIARNVGVPSAWMRSDKDLASIRDAKAKQQQAVMAAQAAESASKSAANLGKAPPAIQDQATAAFSQPLNPASGFKAA